MDRPGLLRKAESKTCISTTTTTTTLTTCTGLLIHQRLCSFHRPESSYIRYVSSQVRPLLKHLFKYAHEYCILKSSEFSDLSRDILMKGLPNFNLLTKEDKVLFLIRKFLKEEKYYENALIVCLDQYFLRLTMFAKKKCPLLSFTDISDIFSNLEDVLKTCQSILYALEDILTDITCSYEDSVVTIATVMINILPQFDVYSLYVSNLPRAISIYQEALENNEQLFEFITVQETLEGYCPLDILVYPAVRLVQYGFLMEILSQQFDENSPVAKLIRKACFRFRDKVHSISCQSLNITSYMAVAELQERIFTKGSVNLITPFRFVVKTGYLTKLYNNRGLKISSSKRYYVVLFNDILLYSQSSSESSSSSPLSPPSSSMIGNGNITNSLKVKHVFSLCKMKVIDIPDSEWMLNSFKLEPFGNQKSVTFIADNWKEKRLWVCLIREYIDKTMSIESPDLIETSILNKKYSTLSTNKGWNKVECLTPQSNFSFFYHSESGQTCLHPSSLEEEEQQQQETQHQLSRKFSIIK
jgi:hypothetical protein